MWSFALEYSSEIGCGAEAWKSCWTSCVEEKKHSGGSCLLCIHLYWDRCIFICIFIHILCIFIYFLWKRDKSDCLRTASLRVMWMIYLTGGSGTSVRNFWPDLGAEGWLLGMTGYSCISVSTSVQGALILNHQLLLTAVLASVCLIFNSKHPFLLYKRFFSLSIPFCHPHIPDDLDSEGKKGCCKSSQWIPTVRLLCSHFHWMLDCFHVQGRTIKFLNWSRSPPLVD